MNHDHDPDDDFLRALAKPIEDEGFTDRVMTALPPKRRRISRSALLGGAFGAAAVALGFSPALPWLGRALTAAASGSAPMSTLVASLALVTTMVLAGLHVANPDAS